MKIFINNYKKQDLLLIDDIVFVKDLDSADDYNYNQFNIDNIYIKKKSLYIDHNDNIYCFNYNLISKKYLDYFFIGNLKDNDISFKIRNFFDNLSGIALHNLSIFSGLVILNKSLFNITEKIGIKEFYTRKDINFITIIKNELSPENLVVNESLYKLYLLLNSKLNSIDSINNIFFEDFILSLVDNKYWIQSLFFLNSKLVFKISNFFNKYNDIISLHIPIARSKYVKDMFEALLLQDNKKFNIFIGVDGYNKEQKHQIVKIIKKYENKFSNFSYFVNKKNLGVGKTRWKLLEKDKYSRYIVFLDDDNFLSSNSIGFIREKINLYPNLGIYSIENIDVRYDINFLDYIFKRSGFNQPGVYTNRERINRLPLYCNQEETPLIHDRFYSDLLNIKYNKLFTPCSIDMVYNRYLETICGNMNFKGAFQFMRVGHKFHQTRTTGFELKEFEYVMYILKTISLLNNNNYYYNYLIKTLIPKQNDLFVNE